MNLLLMNSQSACKANIIIGYEASTLWLNSGFISRGLLCPGFWCIATLIPIFCVELKKMDELYDNGKGGIANRRGIVSLCSKEGQVAVQSSFGKTSFSFLCQSLKKCAAIRSTV